MNIKPDKEIEKGDNIVFLLNKIANSMYCQYMNAGMTRDATIWLADQGVRLVGIDACCWDRPPQLQIESIKKGERKGRYMEGHRAAGERGMCILEWLTNLEKLPHFGFTVYAFPVKIERAGGGWVRVVAFVE